MGMVSVAVENYSSRLLGRLLGASADTEADLVLPRFSGTSKLIGGSQFTYPGEVFSDRDTKSAFHVSNLLTKYIHLNNIFIKNTDDFDFKITPSKLVFVFGSKSNIVTQNLMDSCGAENIFSMDFGNHWTIHSNRTGNDYSIPNPATLSRSDYENKTDYGIIARYLNRPNSDKTTFVIAGLGSRATEGCGIYFSHNWEVINTHFADKNIAAVILKFAPPVTPQHYEVAEWLL